MKYKKKKKYSYGRFFIFSLVLFIFLLPQFNLIAQTYTDAYKPFWYLKGAGSRNTAVAYNSTAYAKGISGLISNPALIGNIKNFQGGISIFSDKINQEARLGHSSNSFNNESARISGLDNIGIIYPVPVYRGNFALGISYTNRAIYNNVSESSGWEYESDQEYRYYLSESIVEEGQLNSLNIASSIEFEKNLFLGLGLHIYNGYRNFQYNGTDKDREDLYYYDDFSLEKDIETDYKGWNFSFGTLYQSDNFKWGIKVATPLQLSAKENSVIDTTMSWDDGYQFDSTLTFKGLEYKTMFPLDISTGVSLNINNIIVTMDLSLSNWNDINFNSNLEDAGGVSADKRIEDNLSKYLTRTTNYGFGLIIPFSDFGNINCGYRLINKPIDDLKDKYKSLNLFAAGFDYQVSQTFMFSLAYQFAYGHDQGSHYFYTDKEENYKNHRFTISTGILFNQD